MSDVAVIGVLVGLCAIALCWLWFERRGQLRKGDWLVLEVLSSFDVAVGLARLTHVVDDGGFGFAGKAVDVGSALRRLEGLGFVTCTEEPCVGHRTIADRSWSISAAGYRSLGFEDFSASGVEDLRRAAGSEHGGDECSSQVLVRKSHYEGGLR